MDTLNRLNDAISFLEDNLLEEPDYEKIAQIAGCSDYHFKRTFPFFVGFPVIEYIRRRRLSLAAEELLQHPVKIIDLAMKYGYSSPDSFTRAFTKFHGVTPTDLRHQTGSANWFPPVSFHFTIQGGINMNYKIKDVPAFYITGISKRVSIQFEGENPEIAAMWEDLTEEKINQLIAVNDMQPTGIIQASANFSEGRMEEAGELDQYIGTATTAVPPEDFSALEVPESQWAVFETAGPFPQTLQETWGRIFSDWFPTSSYELAEGPEILAFKSKDLTSPKVETAIWIPV